MEATCRTPLKRLRSRRGDSSPRARNQEAAAMVSHAARPHAPLPPTRATRPAPTLMEGSIWQLPDAMISMGSESIRKRAYVTVCNGM